MTTEKKDPDAEKTKARLQALHVRTIPILGATRVEIVGYPTLGWNAGRYVGAIDLGYPLLELPTSLQSVAALGDELQRWAAYHIRKGTQI